MGTEHLYGVIVLRVKVDEKNWRNHSFKLNALCDKINKIIIIFLLKSSTSHCIVPLNEFAHELYLSVLCCAGQWSRCSFQQFRIQTHTVGYRFSV